MTLSTRPLFRSLPAGAVGFVLDCSVAVRWIVGELVTDYAFPVLGHVAVSYPVVAVTWPAEVVEAALKAVRAGEVSSSKADRVLAELDVFPISIDAQHLHLSWPAILAVARRYRHRIGPAAALELASRSSLPLATVDPRLRGAAARAGVALFSP